MATHTKFFFGGHDLEQRINTWLKTQPSGFTVLQVAMATFPVEPPGEGTALAVSVWYRLDAARDGKEADHPVKA
jgi:hypothetical protein